MCSTDMSWRLLYTKLHAESWAEANLRRQGFATLMPRVRGRSELRPLFPRYLFAGIHRDQPDHVLRSTYGVLYVVHCGDTPARVPHDVIDEIRGRMDAQGVVQLPPESGHCRLFTRRERERTRALVELARAGFRVRVA